MRPSSQHSARLRGDRTAAATLPRTSHVAPKDLATRTVLHGGGKTRDPRPYQGRTRPARADGSQLAEANRLLHPVTEPKPENRIHGSTSRRLPET